MRRALIGEFIDSIKEEDYNSIEKIRNHLKIIFSLRKENNLENFLLNYNNNSNNVDERNDDDKNKNEKSQEKKLKRKQI